MGLLVGLQAHDIPARPASVDPCIWGDRAAPRSVVRSWGRGMLSQRILCLGLHCALATFFLDFEAPTMVLMFVDSCQIGVYGEGGMRAGDLFCHLASNHQLAAGLVEYYKLHIFLQIQKKQNWKMPFLSYIESCIFKLLMPKT